LLYTKNKKKILDEKMITFFEKFEKLRSLVEGLAGRTPPNSNLG
jgi:hypothetical protein